MKKYIILIVVIVLAGLGWYLLYDPASETSNLQVDDTGLETSSTTPTEATSSTSNPSDTLSNTEKDAAWDILQNYITFAKAKNIDGVASLSYQLSTSCKNYRKDTESKNDCDNKMTSVANMGSTLKKSDYTTTWSDSKQIILSTPFLQADAAADIAGYLHGVIFFVKDNGNIKVLSFNPARGIFLPKSATTTEAQITTKLKAAVADEDQDGIEDQVENCIRADTSCTKTNPTKRDTNGDGFWDGVEALFYK